MRSTGRLPFANLSRNRMVKAQITMLQNVQLFNVADRMLCVELEAI